MENIKQYIRRIWKAKYFLIHLVKWDIKYKFRGSKLGVLWTVFQPLLLTLIIASIFGFVFHQEMRDYAPYILSGLLVWDVVNGAVVTNSYSFLQAEAYIRQYSHPVMIYPLRASLVSLSTFYIAFSSFIIWMLIVNPQNVPIGLISMPFTTLLYFLMSWSISLISSHLHIRFRDYPYVMNLVMQVLWYFSPVFFKRDMFLTSEALLLAFQLNPVTQILALIRSPFFDGCFASLWTYGYVILLALVLVVIAWNVNRKCERNVIFYF